MRDCRASSMRRNPRTRPTVGQRLDKWREVLDVDP